jgi:phage recombination protein Bet
MAELALQHQQPAPVQTFSEQEKALIIDTVARGLNPTQFKLFLNIAKKTGLDPLARQIYAVVYDGSMVCQTSIDGYRLIASRTGKFGGTTNRRLFVRCKNGAKITVPHAEYDPDEHDIISASVDIIRTDREQPETGTALWKSFAKYHNGKLGRFWAQMGDLMLIKCAEAQGLRQAFSQDLSGLYIQEEMDQAQPDAAPAQAKPQTITIEKVAEIPAPADGPTKTETKPKKAKKPESVDEKLAAIFQFYDGLGYTSDGLTAAKALILEKFEVAHLEDLSDPDALAAYARKQLREDLKAAGHEPVKVAGE